MGNGPENGPEIAYTKWFRVVRGQSRIVGSTNTDAGFRWARPTALSRVGRPPLCAPKTSTKGASDSTALPQSFAPRGIPVYTRSIPFACAGPAVVRLRCTPRRPIPVRGPAAPGTKFRRAAPLAFGSPTTPDAARPAIQCRLVRSHGVPRQLTSSRPRGRRHPDRGPQRRLPWPSAGISRPSAHQALASDR